MVKLVAAMHGEGAVLTYEVPARRVWVMNNKGKIVVGMVEIYNPNGKKAGDDEWNRE